MYLHSIEGDFYPLWPEIVLHLCVLQRKHEDVIVLHRRAVYYFTIHTVAENEAYFVV